VEKSAPKSWCAGKHDHLYDLYSILVVVTTARQSFKYIHGSQAERAKGWDFSFASGRQAVTVDSRDAVIRTCMSRARAGPHDEEFLLLKVVVSLLQDVRFTYGQFVPHA
jgi:hypothetical protein